MSTFMRLRKLVVLVHCAINDHPGYVKHPGYDRRVTDTVTYSCTICGESKTMYALSSAHERFLEKHRSKIEAMT